MSDHWNSLADQLGTPSLVPHQRKPSAAPVKAKEPPSALKPPLENVEKVASEDTSEDQPATPKVESPSRIRSSWDTVARMFGVGGSSESNAAPADSPTDSLAPTKEVEPAISSDSESIFSGFGKKKDRKPASLLGDPAGTDSGSSPASPVEEKKFAPPPTTSGKPPKKKPGFWGTVEAETSPESEKSESKLSKDHPSPDRDRPHRSRQPDSSRNPSSRSERPPQRQDVARTDSRVVNRQETQRDNEEDFERPATTDRSEDSGDQPERRGRRRNIRRGRNSESAATNEASRLDDEDLSTSDPEESLFNDVEPRSQDRETRPPREPRPSREHRPRGDRPSSDRPSSQRPSSDRPSSDRPSSDRPSDGRSSEPRNTTARSSERSDSRSNETRPPRPTRSVDSDAAPRDRDASRPSRDRGEPRSDSRSSDSRSSESRARPARHDRSDAPAPTERSSTRPPEKRGWDDLDSIDEPFVEVGDDDSDMEVVSDSPADSDEPRKRRRRRRGGTGRRPVSEDVASEEEESGSDSGRQVYGRHADDESDDDDESTGLDRGFKVTAWADAIASIIDGNMENHKRPSSNDHRGRGGNRNNGSNRRR